MNIHKYVNIIIHDRVNGQDKIVKALQRMKKVHKISDLEQLRLFSDPLKLKLLQAFAEAELTPRQVAEELGESLTKLYRHVDALQDAGLIEVVQETRKRGTVERSFRAVAQRFEVDHSLLVNSEGSADLQPIRKMLRDSETEILNALADPKTADEETMTLAKLRVKASPKQLASLHESLTAWLETIEDESGDESEDTKEAGVLIAFYPIEEE